MEEGVRWIGRKRTDMSRGVFWLTVWVIILVFYGGFVLSVASGVAAVVLFAVGALTDSTFLSFAAAAVSVVVVVVFAVLLFIGAKKVLYDD